MMELVGKTNEEKIWNYLSSIIDNKYGVAGLMGNIYFTSLLDPQHVETSFLQKYKLTKKEYTANADKFPFLFNRDEAGYGLANWSFWRKKEELRNYASLRNKSVGDLKLQLEFLTMELQDDYPQVWETICNVENIREVSDKILKDYMGKTGKAIQDKCYKHGEYYYENFAIDFKAILQEGKDQVIKTLQESKFAPYFLNRVSPYVASPNNGEDIFYIPWDNKNWSCVLRYPNLDIAIKIAELAIEADENEQVLFGEKTKWKKTYLRGLMDAHYNPKKINKECYTTDLDFVIDNIRAIGYMKRIPSFQVLSVGDIKDIRKTLIKEGFEIYTSYNYIRTPDNLLPGDILVNENDKLITINLCLGKNYYGEE